MSPVVKRALKEVATVVRGTVRAKPTNAEGGIPFFGIAEISAGGAGAPRLVEPELGSADPTVLERGDVVVALMSKIGRSALVTPRHEGAVLGRECALIRPGSGVSGAWVYVWTQSAQFRAEVARHTSGTTMPRLSYRALADLIIPVPPVDPQRDADALLKEFDDALWKLDQVQAYVMELRTLEVELLFADLGGVE